MQFPEIIPSRKVCLEAVAAALSDEKGRIYLDTSVVLHCYEMNAAASEDLLNALERYEARVGIPVWVASETWEQTRNRGRLRPLEGLADRLRKELEKFSKETTRYIDDDSVADQTKEEFQTSLDKAFAESLTLIKQVEKHEPKTDQTTARLTPFISSRCLPSDLTNILDAVTRTAAMRASHKIPPGFADVAATSEEGEEDAKALAKGKGKRKNPHGDLIIWMEILADCKRHAAERLLLITRDTNKDDWVYTPKKVLDEKGKVRDNGRLVTIPHPLLVHEAKTECPTLKDVQIVSVELLTHVLRDLKIDVDNLAAALQTINGSDLIQPGADLDDAESILPVEAVETEQYVARFVSSDMAYEPNGDNAVDRLIQVLSTETWTAQNQAVQKLEIHLRAATRDQRVQIGRSLAAAANGGAIQPIELLSKALAPGNFGAAVRSDLLIGALAEIYISETAEPRKPIANPGIIDTIYRHEADESLSDAYRAVLGRLEAQSRKYLGLPGAHPEEIGLTISLVKNELKMVTAAGYALLEEDAPPSRAFDATGRDLEMTVQELLEKIAMEYAIPQSLLRADAATTLRINVPGLIGFVAWGPNTGTLLR